MAPRVGTLGVLVTACLGTASPAWSCSVCFGAGDPDSAGFAWSVLILLVPVALVQVLLVRFLLRAARRERQGVVAAAPTGGRPAAATEGSS